MKTTHTPAEIARFADYMHQRAAACRYVVITVLHLLGSRRTARDDDRRLLLRVRRHA